MGRWLMMAVLGIGVVGCGADLAKAGSSSDDVREPKLREQLLDMQAADQEERGGDSSRTKQLEEILDLYGWPTTRLVGEEGASAAWLIAEHSDRDPQLQQRALDLMRAAAAAGVADESELAYLTDRVAVNTGEPQSYGTQVACGPTGAEPKGSLRDPDNVDKRRAKVGLRPLEKYYATFQDGCAASG